MLPWGAGSRLPFPPPTDEQSVNNMIFSQIAFRVEGTSIWTPKYYNSYFGDPQEGVIPVGEPGDGLGRRTSDFV